MSASRWTSSTTPRPALVRGRRPQARPSPPISTPSPSRRWASASTRPPRRLLEPLVAKQPQDAQLQYALGSVLYMQGQLAEAAARLRESLRLDADQVASPLLPRARRQGPGSRRRGDRAAGGAAPALSGSRRVVRSSGRVADERPALRRGGAAAPQGRRAQPEVGEGQLPARPAPRAHGPEGGGGQAARDWRSRFARKTTRRRACSFACSIPRDERPPSDPRAARSCSSFSPLAVTDAAQEGQQEGRRLPPSVSQLEAAVKRTPGRPRAPTSRSASRTGAGTSTRAPSSSFGAPSRSGRGPPRLTTGSASRSRRSRISRAPSPSSGRPSSSTRSTGGPTRTWAPRSPRAATTPRR